jgi:hypothetical protein
MTINKEFKETSEKIVLDVLWYGQAILVVFGLAAYGVYGAYKVREGAKHHKSSEQVLREMRPNSSEGSPPCFPMLRSTCDP